MSLFHRQRRPLVVLRGHAWFKHQCPSCLTLCLTAQGEAVCTCGQYTLTWQEGC